MKYFVEGFLHFFVFFSFTMLWITGYMYELTLQIFPFLGETLSFIISTAIFGGILCGMLFYNKSKEEKDE